MKRAEIKARNAFEKIEYFRLKNISGEFEGPKGDAFDYIMLWCSKL